MGGVVGVVGSRARRLPRTTPPPSLRSGPPFARGGGIRLGPAQQKMTQAGERGTSVKPNVSPRQGEAPSEPSPIPAGSHGGSPSLPRLARRRALPSPPARTEARPPFPGSHGGAPSLPRLARRRAPPFPGSHGGAPSLPRLARRRALPSQARTEARPPFPGSHGGAPSLPRLARRRALPSQARTEARPWVPRGDAERPGRHSHAERGNEGKVSTGKWRHWPRLGRSPSLRGTTRHKSLSK